MAKMGLILAAAGAGLLGLAATSGKKANAAPALPGGLTSPQRPSSASPSPSSSTSSSTSSKSTSTTLTPKAPTRSVTGKSGYRWTAKQVSIDKNHVILMDVFHGNRVVRFSQKGSDKNSRLFVASPAGTNPKILAAALSDFGIKKPSSSSSSSSKSTSQKASSSASTTSKSSTSKPSSGSSASAPLVMSEPLKKKYALALQNLGVDENGLLEGQCDKSAIQAATKTAGELDRAGFPSSAEMLRSYIAECAKQIPPPPPKKRIPLPPSIPPDLQAKIAKAIDLERDPVRLQVIVDELQKLPPSTERDMAINTLKAMIAQLASEQITAQAVEEIDEVMNAPAAPPPPPPAKPPVVDVWTPKPAPLPPPIPVHSPVQMAAIEMVKSLLRAQIDLGMDGAKRNYDKQVVVAFQKLAGLGSDGKPGPGTLYAAAATGATPGLPFVMFWPVGATAKTVLAYREKLRDLAAKARANGDSVQADKLEESAARERGQGGIVGSMPA